MFSLSRTCTYNFFFISHSNEWLFIDKYRMHLNYLSKHYPRVLSKQSSHRGTPLSSGTRGVSLSAGRLRKVRATQLSETGQRRYALIPPFLTIPTHFYGAPSKYKAIQWRFELASHSGYLPPFFLLLTQRCESRIRDLRFAKRNTSHGPT